MDLLKILENYNAITSLINAQGITPNKVSTIAKLAGYALPDGVDEIIAEVIVNKAISLKETSLISVFRDPEVVDVIATITTDIANSSKANDEGDSVRLIHPNTLVCCPHCEKMIHLGSLVQSED